MTLNGGFSYREQLGADANDRTLVAYLARRRTHSSLAEWETRLRRGEIEIDGEIVRSDVHVRAGQLLVWHRPPWHEPEVPTDYAVLYEDAAIIAIAKPSGLPTMPAGGFVQNTLLALVRAHHPHARPMHRLGRHTSGIVLFAQTHEAAASLARAWRAHLVRKRYRALGSGVALENHFEITAPIGPVVHPTLGSVHAASSTGRRAHSIVDVLERRTESTLFQVEITTGRPHQIRIHLAFAGHPLVGDRVYDVGGVLKESPGLPGDGGYLLHAESLQFAHPLTNATMELHAPAPPSLR